MAATLAGCSALQPVQEAGKMLGAPEAAIQARFGTPTDTYALPDGKQR